MGHLLSLLFEVTELFDMRARPELVLLQKTMVVVEGVARSFDPKFNMWVAAEPVVSEYILTELGPAAKLREARRGVDSLFHLLRRTPEFAGGLEILARQMPDLIEKGIRLDDETLNNLATDKRSSVILRLIAQWIIALSLMTIALGYTFG